MGAQDGCLEESEPLRIFLPLPGWLAIIMKSPHLPLPYWPIMYRRQILALAMLSASTAIAQSAASHITIGDKAYAAMHPLEALSHYEAAIAVDPKSVDALWKASRTAIVLGEFSDSTRDTLYKTGQVYGERAVATAPGNANAQFALAQALGRIALSITDPAGRLPYSRETYHHVKTCLELDPKSAECAHVLGVWNAEVMRVGDMLRSMAISMMGAQELADGSWANAEKYLRQSVSEEPKRATHHLDLARVYADMGDTTKAKVEYNAVLKAPVIDYNDTHYKAVAQKALKDIGNR